jgi:SAM-dependent methyltransferase
MLTKTMPYNLVQNLLGAKRARARLIEEFLRPFPGCKILDIGCGPADILAGMPETIGEYVGFDMNPNYVASARARWQERAECRFLCQKVEEAAVVRENYFVLVMANGVLHHLGDASALDLIGLAHQSLRPGGVLVTLDNVYIENQNWFARWLISKDRGHAVRSARGYTDLAARYFKDITTTVVHDLLRVPYTHFIMRCTRDVTPR